MSGCSWLDDLDLDVSMMDCAASIQHDVVQSAAADQHLSSLQELLSPATEDGPWPAQPPPPPAPQQPAMALRWPVGHQPPPMAAGHPHALAQQQQQGLAEQQLLQNIAYARSPDRLLAATTSYMELLQTQQAAASHIIGAGAVVVAALPEAVQQPAGQQELYAELTAALAAAELLPAAALQRPGDLSAAAGGGTLSAAAQVGLGGCAPIHRCHSAVAALGNDSSTASEGSGSSSSSSNDHNSTSSTWGMTQTGMLFRALSEPICTTAVPGEPAAEPCLAATLAAALQAQQQQSSVAPAQHRQPQLRPHLKFRGTPAAAAGCQTQGAAQAPGTLRVNIRCFKPAANRPPAPPPPPLPVQAVPPELDAAGREQRRRLQHQARLRHYAKLLKLLDARLKPATKTKAKAKRKLAYC